MSCCASAHFSVASSWISAYEADIFNGIGVFREGTGEDGEGGLVEAEDAWREWRMYLAESLSISCWSSDRYNSRSHLKEVKKGRPTNRLLDFLDALSLVKDDRLLPEGCQHLFCDLMTGYNVKVSGTHCI